VVYIVRVSMLESSTHGIQDCFRDGICRGIELKKRAAIFVHIRVLRIYACFSRRTENQPPVSEIVLEMLI